jgi:hypothetical protein
MWTEELRQQTRELFKQMNGAFMKHCDGNRYGLCVLIDGKYEIMDRAPGSNIVWQYDSLEDMIADGWAID